jgi:hypothetical protein
MRRTERGRRPGEERRWKKKKRPLGVRPFERVRDVAGVRGG